MKTLLRTFGVDDGYFPPTYKKSDRKTLLVATSCEGLNLVAVRLTTITVDGLDGTEAVLRCVKSLGDTHSAIFLDGVTYAGFNVVDSETIYRETSTPVIIVFKHSLNLKLIKEALMRNFNDWLERYEVIERSYRNASEVITPKGPLLISCVGTTHANALNILLSLQNINQYPEPLRIADMIASGLTRNPYILNIINQ
ncbi:MAG: DUF99 family protein [Sulfolobales archaeon]